MKIFKFKDYLVIYIKHNKYFNKMCGIFSYLHKFNIYTKSLEFREKILNEFNKIQHRGPDNSTTININDKLIFGFHRLSIVDKSLLGNQPFVLNLDDKKIYLICNGEIYNHKELKLKYNLNTISNSDCEVVLHLYKLFTKNIENESSKINSKDFIQNVIFKIVNELDGVFAFQIFDERNNMLSIARDPIGVRSLYYGYTNNSICFSSELKAINNLSNHVDFFPPGSLISFDINDVHYYLKKNFLSLVQRYYYYNYKTNEHPSNIFESNSDLEKYVKFCKLKIKNLLTNAVDKRIMSDRPIGCLLSGGLDSSLIAALLAKKLKSQGKKLHTFSIGFKNATDLINARLVAEHIDSVHHEVVVTEKEMISKLEDVIYKIESWDTTTVRASTPMVLLCEYIKKNTDITVIYSGEGSDEASGSYMYFHNAPSNEEFHYETCRLVKDLQYFDVLRSDKSVSSAGLEVRVPFLDKEFLDFYMSIDPELKKPKNKYMYNIEKQLLRESFENDNLLPDKILWRVKEAFSDGCSTKEKSWYQIIQSFTNSTFNNLNQEEINKNYDRYKDHHPPKFLESLYYRNVFEEYYPNRSSIIPYYWVPKWCGDIDEPSARVLEVYNAS